MPTLLRASLSQPPAHYVGRGAELERVQGMLNEAALDAGGTLLVEGEPGAGKSRFLLECARLKRTAAIGSARCGSAVGGGADLGAQLAASFQPSATASTLVTFLRKRSRRRATVLFVDDLHLASPGELRILSALIATSTQTRLLVVGCYCRVGRRTFERVLLRWREGGALHLRLPPLRDHETELLLRGAIGCNGQSLDADALRALLHTAQGNPRIAIELAQRVGEGGTDLPAIAPSAVATVDSVREKLPAVDFSVLVLCSIVGEVFYDQWIVDIARRRQEAVAEALQAAVELGVLAEIREKPGWLQFRSVAVREALYASLVSLKRRVMHERAAAYLSARSDDGGDAQQCRLVAEQWHAAGNHEKAASWLTKAAAASFDHGEFRPAAELYERAAGHLARGSDPWLAAAQQLRRCYRNLAEWERMIPIVESILSAEPAAWEPDAEESLLWDLFYAYLNDGELDAARAAADRIARVALPDRPGRSAVAMLIVAYALSYRGRLDDARAVLGGVDAKALADPEARLRECIAKASVDALHKPLSESLELIERAGEIARGLGIRGTVLCWVDGVQIALRYGDLEAARTYVEKAAADAERSAGEVNDTKLRVHTSRMRVALFAGDLPGARDLTYASFTWRDSGKLNQAFIAGIGVLVGMRVGDLALVDALFDPALLSGAIATGEAESCGVLMHGFAEVMQARMMTKELQSMIEGCVAAGLVDPYGSLPYCAARFGSPECAEAALESWRRYEHGAVAPAATAHTALVNAAVARRRGRHIVACEFARDAAARYRRIGWRLAEAAALELAGNYAGASALYAQCGAATDVARLGAAQSRKARRAPFGARLTGRELEVARLALRRRSNDDIARALEISVRTVHHHVESVLSKFGIHSRHQLTEGHLKAQRPS